MKKILTHLVLLSFLCAQFTACSTHSAQVDYKDFRTEGVAIKKDSFKGQDLGKVSGEDGGAIWDDCSVKARGSVERLIKEAKALGANAIGEITWDVSGTSEPQCKKSWGYFLLWPFILTPLFMNTRVDGVAYKVTKLGENMIPMPTNEEEKQALITSLAGQQ